jgi:hypothetical protein
VRGLLGPVAAFDDRRVPICLSLSVSATVRVHRLWFVNAGSEKMSCAERSIGLSEVMSGFSFWLCTRLVGKLERSCIFISCAGFKGLRLGCERCLRFLRRAREDSAKLVRQKYTTPNQIGLPVLKESGVRDYMSTQCTLV